MSDMTNESIPENTLVGRPTLADRHYGHYVTVEEAARRMGCSKRHVERIIAVNDKKKIGVAKIGRRMVRINWPKFDAALATGNLKS